jgi:hypothetical protein
MKKQDSFAEDILKSFGNIDDVLIKEAKKTKHKNKKKIAIGAGIVALCVLIAFFVPFLPMLIRGANSENHEMDYSDENHGTTSQETVIEKGEVEIFFAENGKIKSEKETLPLSPKEIFGAWRDKNSIGKEVYFIKAEIKSNGKESTYEFEGEDVLKYETGDVFRFELTVSKKLEAYYYHYDKDLLLESLEKTMTGYSSVEYDDFVLILK